MEMREKQFEAIRDKEKLTFSTYMEEIAAKKKLSNTVSTNTHSQTSLT
jgi:hypothetical protein